MVDSGIQGGTNQGRENMDFDETMMNAEMDN